MISRTPRRTRRREVGDDGRVFHAAARRHPLAEVRALKPSNVFEDATIGDEAPHRVTSPELPLSRDVLQLRFS